LKHRGEQPRFKQNRLIFLAPDFDSVNRLREQVRSMLAWQSIVADIKDMKLNLDQYQARQASASLEDANDALRRMVRETYKWLLAPMQEAKPGKGLSEVQWEHFAVNAGAVNFSQEIERVLKENELLITEWAPIHLAKVLKDWFWKDEANDASALNVWQQTCQQLYLPRILDDVAYQRTLAAGAESQEFYGFAQGKEQGETGARYLGFSFGQRTTPILDSALLLIAPVAASTWARAQKEAESMAAQALSATAGNPYAPASVSTPQGVKESRPGETRPVVAIVAPAVKNQFYGSVELDPFQAKKQFADVVDEVVLQFTSRYPHAKVKVSVEIQAEIANGFDDSLQRAVNENCKVLKFKSAEFEERGD
jgi:hypothetical protein